ncbi:hypothetical protein SAMN02799630_01422 [Paenibacillus sp. UNCCL117]|uniref:hypothetical protein n=1 Tax=unclassified Paenibacillus TaxID=185978 RepID=UPI00088CB1C6|nr:MULTISPECIES: hypothetical protein [unclassified Paenibacillus]SDC76607.1 hypothetical protein SAMN04488602_103401 [Paenibacillus sp. cl123]SFW25635.1 hypothetical protein SAMN02799630_01422 [Paenibacillus sp. UNCCL117]
MNNKLIKTVATVAISVSLLGSGLTAYAAEGVVAEASTPASVSYKLTDLLDVEIKGALNERIDSGTRLGVTVRMKNNGTAITRVPEYEVRLQTSEGVEYTLKPSASNAKSLQPKATTELSYLAEIDRTDEITLTQVNWTDVDYYVYPKKETPILGVPIQGEAWKGSDSAITDPTAVKKWSESFKIPGLVSPVQYTPVAINKESTASGTVYVVQLLAYNPTDKRENVPAFDIDGKGGGKVFGGSRVEKDTVVLEGKTEKYIHYAIPTDQDTVLQSLNLLTPETFAEAGAAGVNVTSYKVGRLNILLPGEAPGTSFAAYKLGAPIVFDERSQLINPDLAVSIVEYNMHENTEDGNKNVTAKFKLTNKSSKPIAVPTFQADLVSKDGYEYAGSRQAVQTATVLPNSSLTVSYSFTLPVSEKGDGLVLKVQDAVTAAPYKSTIAAVSTGLQEAKKDEWSLYPFTVKVNNWTLNSDYGATTNYQYVYRLKLDLAITRDEQVQLDASFPSLLVELYDSYDRLVGTGNATLFGTSRLVNGDNVISLRGASDILDVHHKVRIYETFSTPTGDAKRLLVEYNQ